MGKATPDGAPSGKVFSADVVAALLMSFNVTSITLKQYELMSAMDGAKTASAFQHDFRSVLAKAKELKARVDGGEEFLPVQPPKKRSMFNFVPSLISISYQQCTGLAAMGTDSLPTTPKKPKVTPSKAKVTPKSRGKGKDARSDSPTNELGNDNGVLPSEMDQKIKIEH